MVVTMHCESHTLDDCQALRVALHIEETPKVVCQGTVFSPFALARACLRAADIMSPRLLALLDCCKCRR